MLTNPGMLQSEMNLAKPFLKQQKASFRQPLDNPKQQPLARQAPRNPLSTILCSTLTVNTLHNHEEGMHLTWFRALWQHLTLERSAPPLQERLKSAYN